MKSKLFNTLSFAVLTYCMLLTNNGNAQIIITAAGNLVAGYSGDGGQAINAKLNGSQNVAFDHSGNLYIADYLNHVVRKVDQLGIITTVVGNGTNGYSGDGGPATAAQLSFPQAMAFDNAGNLYVADYSNSVIRKVNTAGIISTYMGHSSNGFLNLPGPVGNCGPFLPSDIRFDLVNNLFVSAGQFILKVNTSGIVSLFAGDTSSTGYSGDGGQAINAKFANCGSIALDLNGNLYLTDTDSATNTEIIRKINSLGIITRVAGGGHCAPLGCGDGGLATAASLGTTSGVGLVCDAVGNVYVTCQDTMGTAIRMINSSGIINTYAGGGSCGSLYCGDGGPATAAELNQPAGIAFDPYGDLFIADVGNNTVREVGKCIVTAPQICMVEVDSLSQNNIIYWQNVYAADTFYIYRDTANYNYALIGKVPADSISMFTDTVRHLYAANGDPNASSWRYKIAYKDTCGGEARLSPLSPFHQTVFMLNLGSGNFNWSQYQIEGETQPVPQLLSYYFEVDSSSNGHYHIVQTLSASSTSYHDSHYATYPNPTWRSTAVGFNCSPSALRLAGGGNNSPDAARVRSHSNVSDRHAAGIKQITSENNLINIYPNPNNGSFVIEPSRAAKQTMQVYDVNGKLVLSQIINGKTTIDASSLSEGVYNISIISNEGIVNKKLVIVK